MNKLTVILIDDDINQKMIIGKYLKLINSDINFIAFIDANTALDFLKENTYLKSSTVIFLDIVMPIVDGWDFLDEYKKFENRYDVILFSSSIADLDIQKSKQYSDVKQFVVKPIDKDHLLKVIDVYVDALNYI